MRARRLLFSLGWLALGTSHLGCEPRSLADGVVSSGPLQGDFALSDVFSASGFMGDGEHRGPLLVTRDTACAPRWPNAKGSCFTFTYRVDDLGWAGVYYQYPANNWGSEPGRDVADKYASMNFLASASYRIVLPEGKNVAEGCDDTSICRPGLTCEAGRCTPSRSSAEGSACLVSAECASGFACIAQKCAAHSNGVAGDACPRGRDEFCGDGLRCGESDGAFVCVADGKGDVGASCKSRNDCASGLYCRKEDDAKSCQPSTRTGPLRFMIGGIAAQAAHIEYSDEIGVEYSPKAGQPAPLLLPDFERFSIDLSGVEMTTLIGGFLWATAFPDIDEIRKDGKKKAYLADPDSPLLLHFDDLVFVAETKTP